MTSNQYTDFQNLIIAYAQPYLGDALRDYYPFKIPNDSNAEFCEKVFMESIAYLYENNHIDACFCFLKSYFSCDYFCVQHFPYHDSLANLYVDIVKLYDARHIHDVGFQFQDHSILFNNHNFSIFNHKNHMCLPHNEILGVSWFSANLKKQGDEKGYDYVILKIKLNQQEIFLQKLIYKYGRDSEALAVEYTEQLNNFVLKVLGKNNYALMHRLRGIAYTASNPAIDINKSGICLKKDGLFGEKKKIFKWENVQKTTRGHLIIFSCMQDPKFSATFNLNENYNLQLLPAGAKNE